MLMRRIRWSGVGFSYFRGEPVLDGLSLDVEAGLTLVLGPNGSGKSTLLKLAAGVEQPDSGSVLVNGKDLWTREVEARLDLAYLPEQPEVTPFASVDSVLRLVCGVRRIPVDQAGEAARELALEGVMTRSVRELSRGQRHRVLLAAARIGEPGTLVLDEPLSALDRSLRSETLEWIRATLDEGGLVLVVTHELEPFLDLADRAVAMKQGEARLVSRLPRETSARLALLESLAAGL